MRWRFFEGIKGVQADLSVSLKGCFVISHRRGCFTVSYRPPGHHFHVAQKVTLNEAKQAAESFKRPNLKKCACGGSGIGCKA